MGHLAIQFLFSIGIGLYVVVFSRAMFSDPEHYRQRWQPHLPRRQWTFIALRCIAAFCMFCGVLFIASGFVVLPFVAQYRGLKLLASVVGIAAAASGLLAANTPRRQWSRQ